MRSPHSPTPQDYGSDTDIQRSSYLVSNGEAAHEILWGIYKIVSAGHKIPALTPTYLLFEGMDAYLVPAGKHMYSSYLGWNRWFYGGDDFSCMQIFWPDRAGLFPWAAGSDAVYRREQPDLSEHGWRATLSD